MAVERMLTTLHTVDANPANYVTNSWWFDVVEDSERLTIENLVGAGYNSIRAFLSPTLAQNGHEFQWYRQSDPPPRVPVRESTWNFSAAPSGSAIPSEVAMVLSFQAERVSGLSQARRRGRVYLGPFNTTALGAAARPADGLINGIVAFGESILEASIASTGWKWAVFSTVNNDASEVLEGWVDNAYDTQRRRGLEWTARTLLEP